MWRPQIGGLASNSYIGHYGCGRLVKVVTHSPPKMYGPARKFLVDCPGCGYTHKVKVIWRKPIRDGEADEAELEVQP